MDPCRISWVTIDSEVCNLYRTHTAAVSEEGVTHAANNSRDAFLRLAQKDFLSAHLVRQHSEISMRAPSYVHCIRFSGLFLDDISV